MQLLSQLKLSASIGGLLVLAPLAAGAQQAGGAQLEEVVVTARRVEENIQKVPVTVIAVSQEKLAKQNITTGWDLEKLVPGLRFGNYKNSMTSTGGKPLIRARGVQGVVTYLNEAPIEPSGGGQFFDVSSVQMLKGPQGTLFGVAVTAGALLFETRKPTDQFEGYVAAGVGARDHREFEGVINVPVVADKLLVRVGASHNRTDGFIYDQYQGKSLSDTNYWVGRASVTLRPNDRIENLFVGSYYQSDTFGDPTVQIYFNPNGTVARIIGQRAFDFAAQQAAIGIYTVPGAYLGPGGSSQMARQYNVNNKTTFELNDNLSIKNLFSWQQRKTGGVTPLTGTPFNFGVGGGVAYLPNGDLAPVGLPVVNQQFTEELQILGNFLDHRLSFVVGTFNLWSYASTDPRVSYGVGFGAFNAQGRQPLTATFGPYPQPIMTHAIYGHATYDLSDAIEGLKITGGYRYNWDRRKTESVGLNATTLAQTSHVSLSAGFRTPAYDVSLQYEVTPDIMLFVTNSKSYGVGNFNSIAGLPANLIRVVPESVTNLEGGIKSQFAVGDWRARVNATGFYSWYKDAQVNNVTSFINTITGLPAANGITVNIQKVHLQGAEFDITVIPTDSIEVSAAGAILDYGLDRYITPDNVDKTNIPFYLTSASKFVYTLSGTYHFLQLDPSLGEVSLSADWRHNSATTSFGSQLPQDSNPAFGNLDVSLRWKNVWGREGLDASVSVNNVTKNEKTAGALATYAALGLTGVIPAEPRTWVLKVKYAFR